MHDCAYQYIIPAYHSQQQEHHGPVSGWRKASYGRFSMAAGMSPHIPAHCAIAVHNAPYAVACMDENGARACMQLVEIRRCA